MSTSAELVPDPVSHISISGVHGRRALEERLAKAKVQRPAARDGFVAPLVAAALLGAALAYLLAPPKKRA